MLKARFISWLSVVALAAPAAASAAPWEFDAAHTAVTFRVRHMMVSTVHGRFRTLSGTADLDEKAPEKSSVAFEIDAASIDTANEKRDEHLKSADFFDVAKFPKITFTSKKVSAAGKGKYKVVGNLTIHGVTKEVPVEVEVTAARKNPMGMTVGGGSATAKINRKDYGLVWNMPLEGGGVIVGEEVNIVVDFELNKKA